jgi:hypothetical protein
MARLVLLLIALVLECLLVVPLLLPVLLCLLTLTVLVGQRGLLVG